MSGWIRDRRLRIASIVCLLAGLLGAGFLIGWAAGSDQDLVETAPGQQVDESAVPDRSGEIEMPDVRGLAMADARQVITDAGVPASSITTEDAPAAGEPGIVIAQDPVYGEAVGGQVVLTGSTVARVPKIDGREATDVLDDLEELGAQVQTVSRYEPDAVVGSVVSIEPAPGQPLTDASTVVKVVIAAAPGEVSLADLAIQDGYCGVDEDSMNGHHYAELVTCEADRSYPETAVWIIDRAATLLTGTIGVPDSAEPRTSMHVEILGDRTVLATYDVDYGSTQKISVDLTGVLRLSVRVRSNTNDYGTAGLGAAKLLGDQDGLDGIEVD